jgi:hypothetical protein
MASAPWRTTFDSTSDTIVARTAGDIPNELVRRLVPEKRIGAAEGDDTVTFGRIEHIAVTSDNRVFVFDGQGPSLKLFDSSGALVRFVGRKGGGPGEFEQVTGIGLLPNGTLAMWDASHGRVNIYAANGDFSTQWRVPASGFFASNGLQTDNTGAIILRLPVGADKAKGMLGTTALVRFDSLGAVRDTIHTPTWTEPPPTITAQGPGQVGRRNVPFYPRNVFSWSRSGHLLSGPSTPYALYLTHGSGRPRRIELAWTPVSLLPEESDYERDEATWVMRTIDPNWKWSAPSIPGMKPAYSELMSGEDARIWVKVHTTAERIEQPEEHIAEPGVAPRPVRRYGEPNVYDVFEPNGTYLGRVRFGREYDIHRARGNLAWGVLTDSLGVAYVARWRVEPPFQP